jgi:hypothetical protein
MLGTCTYATDFFFVSDPYKCERRKFQERDLAECVQGTSFALFVWLVSHQSAILFSQNKSAISNQLAVLFYQNKLAPAINHQLSTT